MDYETEGEQGGEDNADYGTGAGDSYEQDDLSGGEYGAGNDGDASGGDQEYTGAEESEDGSDATDAFKVYSPGEAVHRMGQFWSGVGDWASGTASSAVHGAEWAWDSATGDDAAAQQRHDQFV